jgi:peptidoglycan/LPS O-acetylase OafA/YrhL
VLNIFFAALGKSHASATGVIALYLTFSIVVLVLSDVALRIIERPGRRAVRETWIKRGPVLRIAAE